MRLARSPRSVRSGPDRASTVHLQGSRACSHRRQNRWLWGPWVRERSKWCGCKDRSSIWLYRYRAFDDVLLSEEAKIAARFLLLERGLLDGGVDDLH